MSKRILVVEDRADNRQIIRDMLAPTDYEITEVESGEDALAAIAKQQPDLILMDIQLPIMDGYTATRRIKADPALRSIKIIAVTSYALSGEEKKAREAAMITFRSLLAPDNYWRKLGNTSPKTGLDCCSAECLLLALSGHPSRAAECPLSGVKRTW
jgi:two-component system cell cycle response regulator DivK